MPNLLEILQAEGVAGLVAAAAMGGGIANGNGSVNGGGIEGLNEMVVGAVAEASEWAYARAYNAAWGSVIPFVVLATAAVAGIKGVKEKMTGVVEASVEKVGVKGKVDGVEDGIGRGPKQKVMEGVE